MKNNTLTYCSLHQHSDTSFLDSLNKPEDLVKRAKEVGMPAIAITDHGNLHNYIKMYKECKKQGIKFIPGIEVYFTNKHSERERSSRHLTILAQNNTGLETIYKLNTLANTPIDLGGGFYYRPRIDWEMLEKHNDGLICLMGCMNSPVNHEFAKDNYDLGKEHAKHLLEIFGKDRFYVELQLVNDPFDKNNRQIYIPEQDIIIEYSRKLASELGLKSVASNDSHYLYKEDSFTHEILKAIDAKGTLQTPIANPSLGTRGRLVFGGFDYHVKSTEEMLEKFSEEEIAATKEIADKCQVNFLLKQNHMPQFSKDMDNDQAYEHLVKQCRIGFNKRKLDKNNDNYINRIKTELSDIKDANLANYFLIVWDTIQFCLNNNIPIGAGRGSAAGSLVSYLLEITNVDPIEHGLIWERFWNRGRKGSMPDIDLDISIVNREKVVDYLKKKFGEDKVFSMMTINKFTTKEVIKDVGKVLGLPFQYMNELTEHVEVKHGFVSSIDEAINVNETLKNASEGKDKETEAWLKQIEKLKSSPDKNYLKIEELNNKISERQKILKSLFHHARKLENASRHRGTHACAMLISDEPTFGKVPLCYDAKKKKMITAYDMYDLEELGYLKLDILGLKTLDVCNEISPGCVRKFSTYNDEKTYELIGSGKTKGIFQLESPLGKQWCIKVKPKNISEISDLIALIRPAVLQCISEDTKILIREYKRGKKNKNIGFDYKTIKDLYKSFHFNKEKGYKSIKKIVSLDESTNKFIRNDIIDIIKTGVKKVYSIKLISKLEGGNSRYCLKQQSNSLNIEATQDHKFLTVDGWKELKDIKPGDYVAVVNKRFGHRYGNRIHSDKATGYKNYRDTAFYNYQYKCIFCNENKGFGFLDVNHINGNKTTNNNPDNLCFLCPNHHREFTMGLITKEDCNISKEKYRLKFNKNIMFLMVSQIDYAGEKETYDISMKSPHNNFVAGDFIVHNCGMADDYIMNRENPENIQYIHSDLKPILEKTYGCMIYQEQMIEISKVFAGFDLAEADSLRKAVGKKIPEEIEKLKEKFISGVEKKYNKKLGEELWTWIENGANYLFNKSHSLSYATLSYITAYLKVHHTKQFFLSLLNFSEEEQDSQQEIEDLYFDAKSFGINLKTPSILEQNHKFKLVGNNIIFGLHSIKNIGKSSHSYLEKIKDFSWIDILLQKNNVKSKKDTLEALILSGALDHLGVSRAIMLLESAFMRELTEKEIPIIKHILYKTPEFLEKETTKKHTKIQLDNATDLFHCVTVLSNFLKNENVEHKFISSNRAETLSNLCSTFISLYSQNSFSISQIADYETHYLGIPITYAKTDAYYDNNHSHYILEIEKEHENANCCTIGLISRINEKTDKKGRPMAFVTLQDRTGKIDAILFSSNYEAYKSMINLENIVLVDGRKSKNAFIINKIRRLG